MSSPARPPLRLAAWAYLAFVVYGSLVPLDFQPRPFDEALAAFGDIPFLNLGIASRADWVANLLLFIPLAFLWTGALAHGHRLWRRWAVSLVVLLSGVGLSLAIEFAQLFFPPRTVSQNDVLAEGLGALLGVAVWWWSGERLVRWYAGWREEREPAGLADRLAWVWVGVAFAYGVMPLDLTISAAEVFHKWREGRLELIPFASLPADPVHALYELTTDALLWLPPALLWRIGGCRRTSRALGMALAAAVLLEFLQIFVYSRTSAVTDLLTAALGAAAGAALGGYLERGTARRPGDATGMRGSPAWLPAWLALAWILVLPAVFWYPYDFRADGAFVRERLEMFGRVPFHAYYYGTEFRAITEVFHKLLFFAPLGVFLAWFVARLPWLWRFSAAAASLAVLAMTALGIELGQVLLPGKHPDSTDGVLEALGGVSGYLGFRLLHARLALRRPPHGRNTAIDA